MRMAEMVSRTLPCPCCGAVPKWEAPGKIDGPICGEIETDSGHRLGEQVGCLSCDFEGPYGKDDAEAIAKWNSNARHILEVFSPRVVLQMPQAKAVAA